MKSNTIKRLVCICFGLIAVSQGQEKTLGITPPSNVSHRNSFCEYHRRVENGEISRRDALRGHNVSIALFDYQIKNGQVDESQISVMFINALADRAGFSWKDSYGVYESPNDNNNATFSDLLYQVSNEFDLVGDYYNRRLDRLENGIVFVEYWYDGSLIMVTNKNNKDSKFTMNFFLSPFTLWVWLLIGATILVSGFSYYVVDYLDSRVRARVVEGDFLTNLFYGSYAFVGHALYEPRSSSTRLIAWSVAFMAIVLMSLYEANMTKLLVVLNTSPVVLNDIQDAIKTDQIFCVWEASTADTFLQEHYSYASVVRKKTEAECTDSIKSYESHVFLTFASSWEIIKRDVRYNGDCDLQWVGRTVKPYQASFSSKDSEELCTSILSDILSLHMVDMKIDGSFDEIWERHLATGHDCDNLQEEETSEIEELQVTVKQVGGLFIFHFCLIMLAFLISLFQCWRKTSKEDRRGFSSEFKSVVRGSATLNKLAERALSKEKKSFSSRFKKMLPGTSRNNTGFPRETNMFGDIDTSEINVGVNDAFSENRCQSASVEDVIQQIPEDRERSDKNRRKVSFEDQYNNANSIRDKSTDKTSKKAAKATNNDVIEVKDEYKIVDNSGDGNSSAENGGLSDAEFKLQMVEAMKQMTEVKSQMTEFKSQMAEAMKQMMLNMIHMQNDLDYLKKKNQ